MEKFPEIPTAETIKAKADEVVSKVPATAQEYFDKMTGAISKTKVVEELVSDVKENPKKVGCEAGIAGLAGAAVFAGLRFYDSYVANKSESEPSEEFEPYEAEFAKAAEEIEAA